MTPFAYVGNIGNYLPHLSFRQPIEEPPVFVQEGCQVAHRTQAGLDEEVIVFVPAINKVKNIYVSPPCIKSPEDFHLFPESLAGSVVSQARNIRVATYRCLTPSKRRLFFMAYSTPVLLSLTCWTIPNCPLPNSSTKANCSSNRPGRLMSETSSRCTNAWLARLDRRGRRRLFFAFTRP